ncbi:cytochrome c-type biogenesis protein CcmH [Brucella sp. MAB-22]|uniref:cytochrome c-type biogenesis protein n=1 Tax=Brucella TaxID=234 RepID=UPI002220171A|nr:cytochrome c-type biogenesis protein [Brucella sp. MAB-22]UYT57385.1 cytochrome c-type biogenesis protein CcmH [Brucella sp. MAB-22]
MRKRSAFAALLLGAALAIQGTAALAVNPDEVLSDPALEKRARTISGELRCMVCQNESIDDSNAELARDLRVLVRDRLKEGDSDEQVMDFIVDRYGEFVLLKPRLNARTVLLWGFPVVVLLIGAVALAVAFRGRKQAGEAPKPLTESEKAELARLLDGK